MGPTQSDRERWHRIVVAAFTDTHHPTAERKRPRRDVARPQAPHPWRKQVERNIFYKRRGRWYEAWDAARSPYERAHWRQFFGLPAPVNASNVSQLLATVYRKGVAGAVDGGHVLLSLLR